MFYARYRYVHTGVKLTANENDRTKGPVKKSDVTLLAERWIAIDASKIAVAKERAGEIHLPNDRFLAEDAEVLIDVFDERDFLDLRMDRTYLVEKFEERDPSVREAAFAEILNLLRETLNDMSNRIRVQDAAGNMVETIRIKDLFEALNSGKNGDAYLATGSAEFEKERDLIIKNLFSSVGKTAVKRKRKPKTTA